MTTRAIRVVSGSVQFRVAVDGQTFNVDVWSTGDRWQWTAGTRTRFAEGERSRWSEARTAAFRACVKRARE